MFPVFARHTYRQTGFQMLDNLDLLGSGCEGGVETRPMGKPELVHVHCVQNVFSSFRSNIVDKQKISIFN